MPVVIEGVTLALALQGQPILEKVYSPGFVPPDRSFSEKCGLFADRLEIVRDLAGTVVTETRGQIDAFQLPALLAKAASEELSSEDNNLCDAPATTITGHLPESPDGTQVLLFSSGGCGTPRQTRKGGAAWLLTRLIDSLCPTEGPR